MKSQARPVQHPEVGVELVRDWDPDTDALASVILVHGLAEHSGRYERTGSLLSDAGFRVRSFDLIGAGATGGPRWHIERWADYWAQIESHMDWARTQNLPVVLMGHSMGGNLALGYTLSGAPKPDLLVLSAPALAGGAAWQRKLAPIAARLAPRVTLANPVDGDHLSRDSKVAEDYFADPLVVTKSSFKFGALAFDAMDDLNERMVDLDVPTLVVHGGEDQLVPTASSERLETLDCVERKVYKGLRHEILNEPEGPEVVADIVVWLNNQLNAS